jgi:hypothetical protein
VEVFHGDRIQVDAVEAPDVDRPLVWCRARAPEWENAADRTKIVARGVGVKRIEPQIFERRQESELFGLYAMNERSAPPADRAVSDTDMVEFGLDLEPNAAAVTGASIGLFHRIANWQ